MNLDALIERLQQLIEGIEDHQRSMGYIPEITQDVNGRFILLDAYVALAQLVAVQEQRSLR